MFCTSQGTAIQSLVETYLPHQTIKTKTVIKSSVSGPHWHVTVVTFYMMAYGMATPIRIGDRAINMNQLFIKNKKINSFENSWQVKFFSLFFYQVNTQTPNAIFFHHYYSEKLIPNILGGEEVPYHLSTTGVKILSIIKFKGSNYIIILKFTG